MASSTAAVSACHYQYLYSYYSNVTLFYVKYCDVRCVAWRARVAWRAQRSVRTRATSGSVRAHASDFCTVFADEITSIAAA